MNDSGLTYAEIKLRTAEPLGFVEDSASGIIVQQTSDVLDRVERAVRDAVRHFWRMARWSFAYRRIRNITVSPNATGTQPSMDGDTGIYIVPGAESAPIGVVTWKSSGGSAGGNGLGGSLSGRTMDELEALDAAYPTATGTPQAVAFEWDPAYSKAPSDERGVLTMRVFPRPDQEYTFSGKFKTLPWKFGDDNQVGPWPTDHDQTIVDLARWYLAKTDATEDAGSAQRVREFEKAAMASLSVSLERAMDIEGDDLPSPSQQIERVGIPIQCFNSDGALLLTGVAYQ